MNEANSRSSDVEAGNLQKQMCETRDLGIKWPHGHALIFEGEVRIDMRNVGPKRCEENASAAGQDWKKWAAENEYEELKVGCLGGTLALLRKKTKEDWTEKSIETWLEHWYWKVAGCSKDCSTLGWSDKN